MKADEIAPVVAPMEAADRRETRQYLLLLLPALLALGVFFVYPLCGILLRSVYKNGYTLESYRQVARTSVYLMVIALTFRTAAVVTLIALLLGYPLGYVLATVRPRLARVLVVIVVLPFLTSIIVRTYAWMVLLGSNGVVNQYLQALGLTHQPLRAAHSLGANRWQAFRRVFLPLSAPGIVGGALLVFILSLGFFITPALMGGPSDVMIAMLIEREVEFTLNWSFASALAVILLALSLVGFAAYYRLVRLERLFEGLG